MDDPDAPFRHFIPIRDLTGTGKPERTVSADETERAKIAQTFGLLNLAKFSVTYALRPEGAKGWRLNGRVAAKFAQACVITLDPVLAKVNEPFTRLFEPGAPDPFAAPEDAEFDLDLDAEDPAEPLGEGVDVGAAALETLSLAIDPYPRRKDAEFAEISTRPEGAEPLDGDARKPFAALAELRKSMGEDG